MFKCFRSGVKLPNLFVASALFLAGFLSFLVNVVGLEPDRITVGFLSLVLTYVAVLLIGFFAAVLIGLAQMLLQHYIKVARRSIMLMGGTICLVSCLLGIYWGYPH